MAPVCEHILTNFWNHLLTTREGMEYIKPVLSFTSYITTSMSLHLIKKILETGRKKLLNRNDEDDCTDDTTSQIKFEAQVSACGKWSGVRNDTVVVLSDPESSSGMFICTPACDSPHSSGFSPCAPPAVELLAPFAPNFKHICPSHRSITDPNVLGSRGRTRGPLQPMSANEVSHQHNCSIFKEAHKGFFSSVQTSLQT